MLRICIFMLCSAFLESDGEPFLESDGEPLSTKQWESLPDGRKTSVFGSVEEYMQNRSGRAVMFLFVGDSLIRNQYVGLCRLIQQRKHVEHTHTHTHTQCGKDDHECECTADNMTVRWIWAMRWDTPKIESTADVVYFGSALHQLHLEPARPWGLYANWKTYETDFQRAAGHYREQHPNAKLVAFFAHSICESKYHGDWQQIAASFEQHVWIAAAPCKQKLSMLVPNISAVESITDCLEGLFLDSGVAHINRRLKYALAQNPHIRSVNGYELTKGRCDATNDGRHYNELVLDEIDLLFDALS